VFLIVDTPKMSNMGTYPTAAPPAEAAPPGMSSPTGRDDRQAMDTMFFVRRIGCQWNALNATGICSSSAAHRRFQEWTAAGVFLALWNDGLATYEALQGIDWEWLAMDGAMTKAPLGGKKVGKNPTDRGKIGTKRSLLTDGGGVPSSGSPSPSVHGGRKRKPSHRKRDIKRGGGWWSARIVGCIASVACWSVGTRKCAIIWPSCIWLVPTSHTGNLAYWDRL
jgi:transposase